MSDAHEERARRMIAEAKRLDPDLVPDEEEAVREMARALPKVEAAMGGDRPHLSQLLLAPFTGRLHGVEVERGLWPWGLVLLKVFGAIVGPIFGLLQGAMFWNLGRKGLDARLTDAGVETFSKRKGHVATHPWGTIKRLQLTFQPPLTFWELVLADGKVVALHMAGELDPNAFREHGIEVDEKSTIR
jgi:hypothetical protein